MAGADPKRARAGGGSTRDRLSALPDELLLRVLSFLPAQQVVRTTVLSKRWTHLWCSVPGVNLSFRDFVKAGEGWEPVMERMEDFVDNLLMLHRAPCLDAFRLVAIVNDDDLRRHVGRWVRRAIKDNPLLLEVSAGDFPSVQLQLPYLSSSPCRRLRTLHPNGVTLDHSFTERLHSWWPDLKDLSLRYCHAEFSSIESDKLENLVVFYCGIQPEDVFTIRAPHLAFLSVCLSIPFSLDVNSLVRASISLNYGKFSPISGAMLLCSLSNVTTFQLQDFQTMAALDEEFDDVPIFHNLRTLSLETRCTNNKFKAVGRFLQKSPNLEKLTLKYFKVVQVGERVHFPILKNLRTLCLHCCDLDDNFQILHQCLQNSPNLETLNIWHCKLSNDSMGGKGEAKSKKTMNLTRFQCPKLEYAEISRSKEDAGVAELVRFLVDFAAPTITIKVTSI